MKYIQYFNELTGHMRDGFIVKEDHEQFWLADPISYDWLKGMNKLEWLENVPFPSYDISFFPYRVEEPPTEGLFLKGHTWILNFPLTEEMLPEFPMMVIFVEWALSFSSLMEGLKQAHIHTKSLLAPEVANQLAQFMLQHKHQFARIQYALSS